VTKSPGEGPKRRRSPSDRRVGTQTGVPRKSCPLSIASGRSAEARPSRTAAAIARSSAVRVAALAARVPLYTTIAGAEAVTEAIGHLNDLEVVDLRSLHCTAVTTAPLNLFIRQPFTESDDAQQQLIAQVMRVIDSANEMPRPFVYLTGLQAESATTFKPAFEAATGQPFTPQAFRRHRLELLKRADAFVNIRVGMSESSAFEIAYHIFAGRRTPMLFLVWKKAPIKTTLLRDMQDLCEVTYLEFDHADELAAGVRAFFGRLATAPGAQRSEDHHRSVTDSGTRRKAVSPDCHQPCDWTERGDLQGVPLVPADVLSIPHGRPGNEAGLERKVGLLGATDAVIWGSPPASLRPGRFPERKRF